MKFLSAVIFCAIFTKISSLCSTKYTTFCDNVSDVKEYCNKDWLSLTVGDPQNEHFPPNETLDKETFTKCLNLEELSVRGRVTQVDSKTLMPLRKLLVLNLHENSLETLSDFTFVAVPQLMKLSLQNNNIKQLTSEGPFINSALRTVNLSHNKMRSLQIDIFKIAGLERLEITHNLISEIAPRSIFSPDLVYLNMDNNLLYHISADVFKDMDKLDELILSNNQFTILRIKYHIKSLRTLDFSYNSINIIDPNVFEGMPNLLRLYLDHNLIKKLPVNLFETTLKQLKITDLQLQNNRLENLQFLVKNQWEALDRLIIAENPWPCDCLDKILVYFRLAGIKLSNCDTSYLNDGGFPVCIQIATDWDDGECFRKTDPGDAYDVFLNAPRRYTCYTYRN